MIHVVKNDGSAAMATTLAELVKEKRADILALAAKHGARNVRVFGSVARGDADEQSDIDVLVQMAP